MKYQNIKELFTMQKELDNRIAINHEDIKPDDNSAVPEWKFLALFVELGECANEWRGFKVWSNNRNPITVEKLECFICNGTGDENYEFVQEAAEGTGRHEYIKCTSCEGTGYNGTRNPLLEETVDCLHFVLSMGNDIGYKVPGDIHLEQLVAASHYPTTLQQFNAVIGSLSDLNLYVGGPSNKEMNEELYEPVLLALLALTEKLEFTWEEIVKAYKDKNKVNHDRQNKGY